MRRLTVIFMCFALAFSLFSCSSNPSVSTLCHHLIKLYPSAPPCSQYVKNCVENEYGYISAEDFFYLYTGRAQMLPEWELIEDFQLILSDTDKPFELHVILAVSSSDIDEIVKLLNKRAELIRYHNKTESSYLSCEPSVFVHGRYAVLAGTEDNNAVKLLLKDL